ncbi:uncharacterized protein LOC118180321 [Stegodyphus dumicola]|uniref:uncharacterized protein LOC118180321 n=1 Tax=Stegodyphus dumicola TaxID=202533 RepID=UPI0015AB3EFE|nr:uncharacterized protein LOC118180321 [Stegodyphus dumicola]
MEAEEGEFITPNKKAGHIPPIVLADFTGDWDKMKEDFEEQLNIKKYRGNLSGGTLTIRVYDSDHYRTVTEYLTKLLIPFHTFKLNSEKPIKAIIKKLPKTANMELIKNEIAQEVLNIVSIFFRAEVIAIGNGTACRETEVWLSDLIKKNFFEPLDVKYCIINESGVSIYSVTKEAELELPDMDPNVRSAVSIARRLQDPLLEYVKVEPKHLGVGMYQHDVPEAQLKKALDSIVEECVSFVGVDLNVCPEFLLRKISGLTATRAKQIVEWRTKNGCFINRQQLLQVKGLGQKSFEQCAGFVKVLPQTSVSTSTQVPDAEEEKPKGKKAKKSAVFAPNLLDQTIIHPESYNIAEKFLEEIKGSPQEIGQQLLVDKVSQYMKFKCIENVATQFSVSVPLMQLIIDALKQLHDYDIRGEFEQPLFLTSVRTFSDLKVHQKLTGCVRNVTAFGAFVDVGVGADGLIHVSKMKGQKLSVGDKVSVLVKSVDIDKKRLDLELCTDSDVKQEPQCPSSKKAQIQPRLFADLKVNQELTGCVTNITAFGAFVDVGVGKDGLLHISKMAGQNLNIGDTITVFVQNVDFDKKQLQLNLGTNLKFNQQSSTNVKNEQLKPMPFTDLKINQELTGVVKNIAPYGAFIDIGVGPNGLIHISRMRGKELNIGDIVSVVVKSVDFKKKRIELEFCTESKVKTEPNNFNNLKKEQSKSRQFTDLRVNEELTGFVRNVTMYGAFVDVGVGSNGLIHVSKMKGQQLQVGEKVSVRLRSIDYQRKRLELELLCVF